MHVDDFRETVYGDMTVIDVQRLEDRGWDLVEQHCELPPLDDQLEWSNHHLNGWTTLHDPSGNAFISVSNDAVVDQEAMR